MFILQESRSTLEQQQHLLINLAMKQAFHVMQLPVLELSEWLSLEIENNPVLEVDLTKETFKESLEEWSSSTSGFRNKAQEKEGQKRKERQESVLVATPSLYEHLMSQAPLVFETQTDLHLAELLIGSLNSKGFLDIDIQDVAPYVPLEKLEEILQKIQKFDPPGIGAKDLQHTLLLQLTLKGKKESLAFHVIKTHFEALIHNRLPSIAKALRIELSSLTKLIEKEISSLDLYPGSRFSPKIVASIIPDILLFSVEGKWHIEINTSQLPHFHIAPIYADAMERAELEPVECLYVRKKLAAGKWLQRAVQKRNQTLHRLVEFVLKKQEAFFQEGRLIPMTTAEAALELGLHESTVARAVAHKFIACPQGLFALRSFFKQGSKVVSKNPLSSVSLKEFLEDVIEKEDKTKPLSDEEISSQLKRQGIVCARRTVAKYRTALHIAPALRRRTWS